MRPRAVLLLAVVAPSLAVVAILAGSSAWLLATGQPLVWPPRDVTLPEAVVLRDQADVARQILNGADPNARYDVNVLRPGRHDRLTPLEAAIATRELYMVQLVIGYGGVVDRSSALTLQCLARAVNADEIVAYLASFADVADSCEGVALPYR